MFDERATRWLSQPTCSVVQAATMLGLSRNAAYEACDRGEIQCVRIGTRIRVLTAPLRKMLLIDDAVNAAA